MPTRINGSRSVPFEYNLQLLEAIGQNPRVTQADLATQLGIAVGTVNWYLKRLIARGFVKIQRMQRKRLLYLITPRGLAEKSRLGVLYMQASLQLYRQTRAQAIELLNQTRQAGFTHVIIQGNEEIAEICRLTCLEQGMRIAKTIGAEPIPILQIDGAHLRLMMPTQE